MEVYDTAGVLNEQKLQDVIGELDFHEPTKVAVYSRDGEYSDNINTETLLFAKDSHPEWISSDPEDYGDYWSDGYFIITLSVEDAGSGQIGTYFGEDRKVTEGQMQKIHEAGYDNFRAARWTDGIIDVATAGAGIINRPWYLQPGMWIFGAVVALVGGGTALGIFGARASRRSKFAEHLAQGQKHLSNVTMDLESTELSARTLPTGSRHAADLERRFADFMTKYRESFTKQQELEAATKKERGTSAGVQSSKNFSLTAQNLDATDDAIIAAAALYTRSSTWEDAWRAQIAPLLEDLKALPELTAEAEEGTQGAAAALDSFAADASSEIERIGTDLKAENIDVDSALDRLTELRKLLTERLDAFATAQIEAYAESEEEKRDMQEALRNERTKYSNRGYRSGGSILDVTSPGELFWRVQSFNTGYHAGVNSVTSSRQAASSTSSGISSGYSGGGGSFSGSGGSSRF
ncbi:DUF5129 domain-containing protein [Glutamicibacter sp.]|uniref:DUF5129 domain-containing protein n=1 Tax=Glutamicibacter sp. TaxID=1931995 RepID=UPI0028BDECD8|nr:DUF5129 domain-containing protein [Glutamicibacter sp.]